ncbi:MAG: sulfotransferase family protein [Alphaproteobacteria bacterium]
MTHDQPKVFDISLPRHGTVSMQNALHQLGFNTAHLGHIIGSHIGSSGHSDPARLKQMYEQIKQGDYKLDILNECDGLGDYPICAPQVFKEIAKQYPDAKFIHVKRRDVSKWLQSVEVQFVGSQFANFFKGTQSDEEFTALMQNFREMTFGQKEFDPTAYTQAMHRHYDQVKEVFADQPDRLLEFDDISEFNAEGFSRLAKFLGKPDPQREFPLNNTHSSNPQKAFIRAVEQGLYTPKSAIDIDELKKMVAKQDAKAAAAGV